MGGTKGKNRGILRSQMLDRRTGKKIGLLRKKTSARLQGRTKEIERVKRAYSSLCKKRTGKVELK